MYNNFNNSVVESSNSVSFVCQNCGAVNHIQVTESKDIMGITVDKGYQNLGCCAVGKTSASAHAQSGQSSTPSAPVSVQNPTLMTSLLGMFNPDTLKSNPAFFKELADMVHKIEESGYLEVQKMVRRFLPAHALWMVEHPKGFHAMLKWRGYRYSWRVVANDLKSQMNMFIKGDKEGLADRQRWYNSHIVEQMGLQFLEELKKHVNNAKKHGCLGRKYVKVGNYMNRRGLFLDQAEILYNDIAQNIRRVVNSTNPVSLYNETVSLAEKVLSFKFEPKNQCEAFMNAYKAAGAYYTMKDLILFEGCKMRVIGDKGTRPAYWYPRNESVRYLEQKESLEWLEKAVATDCPNPVKVATDGYMLLGLLKDFLEYNNFNYKATTEKWAKQSEARKQFRMANKDRRSRK